MNTLNHTDFDCNDYDGVRKFREVCKNSETNRVITLTIVNEFVIPTTGKFRVVFNVLDRFEA